MADEPKHQDEPFAIQVIEKTSQLAAAAFGLVAALAWNDFIKSVIAIYISPGNQFRTQMIYAVVVTLLAVLVAIWLAKAAARAHRRWERRRERRQMGGAARPA